MTRVALAVSAAVAAFSAHAIDKSYVRIRESDFDRGYVRAKVTSGERLDFSAPASATAVERVALRGSSDGYVRVHLPWWPFWFCGRPYYDIVVMGNGTIWLSDDASISPGLSSLGLAPRGNWPLLPESCRSACLPLGISSPERVSVLWYEITRDRVRVTWQNALLGRDEGRPVSYQVDLFRTGDFTMRFDLSRVPAGDPVFLRMHSRYGVARPTTAMWRILYAVDRDTADLDGDGLSTEQELMDYGTDPHSPDTDFDSLYDGDELFARMSPTNPDMDGDGFQDATDPFPGYATSWEDGNGDGFPDMWVMRWFRGETPDPYADAGGDGIPNLASLYIGVDPTTRWDRGAKAPGAGLPRNCRALRITPKPFSFSRPASLTNLVDKTFRVDRVSPWQQLFVTSDLALHTGWSARDIVIRWDAGSDGGTVPLSASDSFRIPLSDDNITVSGVRFRVAATGPDPYLDRPLFLVVWVPAIAYYSAGYSGPVVINGTPNPNMVGVRNDPYGDYLVACDVSYAGYPHNGGMDPAVEASLGLPALQNPRLEYVKSRVPYASTYVDALWLANGPVVGAFLMPPEVERVRVQILPYTVSQ